MKGVIFISLFLFASCAKKGDSASTKSIEVSNSNSNSKVVSGDNCGVEKLDAPSAQKSQDDFEYDQVDEQIANSGEEEPSFYLGSSATYDCNVYYRKIAANPLGEACDNASRFIFGETVVMTAVMGGETVSEAESRCAYNTPRPQSVDRVVCKCTKRQ